MATELEAGSQQVPKVLEGTATDRIIVRAGPDLKSKKVGAVARGDIVVLTGEEQEIEVDGEMKLRVEIVQPSGWITRRFIDVHEASEASESRSGTGSQRTSEGADLGYVEEKEEFVPSPRVDAKGNLIQPVFRGRPAERPELPPKDPVLNYPLPDFSDDEEHCDVDPRVTPGWARRWSEVGRTIAEQREWGEGMEPLSRETCPSPQLGELFPQGETYDTFRPRQVDDFIGNFRDESA